MREIMLFSEEGWNSGINELEKLLEKGFVKILSFKLGGRHKKEIVFLEYLTNREYSMFL